MLFRKGVYAIIATLFWGASFPLIKIGLKTASPLFFAFSRYIMASFLFIALFLLSKRKFTLDSNFFLVALVGISIPVILQNIALQYAKAYVSGFLQSTGPIYTLIFAGLFLNEKFTWNKIAGISIAFVSTYFLLSGYTGNLESNILLLISAFFYSMGSILSKKLINEGKDGIDIIANATILASFLLLIPLPFEEIHFNISFIPSSILLAVFPTFLSYILWYKAMEEMEISRLSCFVYLIPFFSMLFSVIFLHEKMEAMKILYGIGIIIGIAMAEA